MTCFGPQTAYFSKERNALTGKRSLVFNREASHSGIPLKVPCGGCIGCRLAKQKQWTIRLRHEAQMSRNNSFLTLTYNSDFLPEDRSLSKRHLTIFMKRLRKKFGANIRFFACGEYGDENLRPHYHVLLFNIVFDDKKYFKKSPAGSLLYESETLNKIWPLGSAHIGEVDDASINYVAGYVLKKRTGKTAPEHYSWVDANGITHSLLPEFATMSRRPGIGASWYAKYGNQTYKLDSVARRNGREAKPPAYYDKLHEKQNAAIMRALKEKRRKEIRDNQTYKKDNTPERRRVREQVAHLNDQRLKRDYS